MASTTPFRLSTRTLASLDQLERKLKKPKRQIVDDALEAYKRKLRFEQAAESWRKLQADPEKWAAYQREVEAVTGLSTSRRGPAR